MRLNGELKNYSHLAPAEELTDPPHSRRRGWRWLSSAATGAATAA